MKFFFNIFNKIIDISLTILGIIYYYIFIKYFPYQSIEKIENHQFQKLRKLLIESGNNVPYYKNLFDKIEFIPERDFLSLDDIKKIPILTKEQIRKDPKNFINIKSKFYITLKTSGSTGNPFKAKIGYSHWIIEQAVIWRQWKSFNYNFRDSIAILRSFAPKENEPLIKVDYLRNFIFYSPYHLNDKNMEVYYRDMLSRRIKFLRGYPSSIKLFTDYCKRKNYKLHSLKGILLASETLNRKDKNFIKDYFQVPVINHYGLAECIVMIGNIDNDNYLYNYDDYGYIEILQNNIHNRIIGTNLNNFTMPLIRYDTGDYVDTISSGVKKDSKINLKKISSILGRSNDEIIAGDKKIPLINIYTTFSGYEKIVKYQIIQQKRDLIKIIVMCNEIDQNEISNDIYKDMYFLKNDNIKIDIEFSQNFKRLSEGKIPSFIGL